MSVIYRFVGEAGVPGVPARDLTEEEAKEHGVTGSPAYERTEDAEKPKRRKAGEEEGN